MTMLLDSPAIVAIKNKDEKAVSTIKVDKVMIHSLECREDAVRK